MKHPELPMTRACELVRRAYESLKSMPGAKPWVTDAENFLKTVNHIHGPGYIHTGTHRSYRLIRWVSTMETTNPLDLSFYRQNKDFRALVSALFRRTVFETGAEVSFDNLPLFRIYWVAAKLDAWATFKSNVNRDAHGLPPAAPPKVGVLVIYINPDYSSLARKALKASPAQIVKHKQGLHRAGLRTIMVRGSEADVRAALLSHKVTGEDYLIEAGTENLVLNSDGDSNCKHVRA